MPWSHDVHVHVHTCRWAPYCPLKCPSILMIQTFSIQADLTRKTNSKWTLSCMYVYIFKLLRALVQSQTQFFRLLSIWTWSSRMHWKTLCNGMSKLQNSLNIRDTSASVFQHFNDFALTFHKYCSFLLSLWMGKTIYKGKIPHKFPTVYSKKCPNSEAHCIIVYID